MEAFIKFITEYMAEHNLSKSEFAKIINVSEYLVKGWLNKTSKVRLNHLIAICDNLNVKAEEVLGRIK